MLLVPNPSYNSVVFNKIKTVCSWKRCWPCGSTCGPDTETAQEAQQTVSLSVRLDNCKHKKPARSIHQVLQKLIFLGYFSTFRWCGGKLQKLQRERLTSFMLYDSWLKITFTWSLFIHLDPPMQAAEKRYFHLERKQYQQFSHFVKEFYSHSFMHAPSSRKLNTIQDSFQDFKECKAGLINGNTSNKIYYWTYVKEIRTVCNLFFFSI